eukprot:scaffold39879_cov16-Tisochrysis_lutea.AAC.2
MGWSWGLCWRQRQGCTAARDRLRWLQVGMWWLWRQAHLRRARHVLGWLLGLALAAAVPLAAAVAAAPPAAVAAPAALHEPLTLPERRKVGMSMHTVTDVVETHPWPGSCAQCVSAVTFFPIDNWNFCTKRRSVQVCQASNPSAICITSYYIASKCLWICLKLCFPRGIKHSASFKTKT